MDEQTFLVLPDGQTQLLALFGQELSRSPSPATHTQWARIRKLNLLYTALQTNSEREFLSLTEGLMRSPHFAGANITNPFKTTALQLSGVKADSAAIRCGAANTLYRTRDSSEESWQLTNTDLAGCSESIKKIMSAPTPISRLADLVILGRGAMMRTILRAAEEFSAQSGVLFDVKVGARDNQPIDSLNEINLNSFDYFNINNIDSIILIANHSRTDRSLLCVNTIPGSTSAETEITIQKTLDALNSFGRWRQKKLLCVSYGEQTWHTFARRLGWEVLNGDLLFDLQARAAFKLWTNVDAPNHPTALPQL